MLFSFIKILIPYLFIYLRSNSSKIQRPNLIFNIKIPLLIFYSFKISFPLSSIIIPYYLIILIVKV